MASFHDRLAEFFKTYGLLFGRLALVVIFFTSGVNHVRNFAGSVVYMQGKMPALPEALIQVLLVGAVLFLFAGTLLVALGFQARLGALLLFLFLLAVTPVFHNFWAVPEDAYRLQFIQFQKNLAGSYCLPLSDQDSFDYSAGLGLDFYCGAGNY